jgi:hypothetical protein
VSREDYSDLAVGPFAALRGLKSVTIESVSDAMAKELETVMTGNSTFVDLPGMLDSLVEYFHQIPPFQPLQSLSQSSRVSRPGRIRC